METILITGGNGLIGKASINLLNLSMNKSVHIFRSLDEQEQHHKTIMLQSTVAERFRRLFRMQQISNLLHPATDKSRKIQIRKWTS